MQLQIIDLDSSIVMQKNLLDTYKPFIYSLNEWGPLIRISCGFRRFNSFEKALTESLGINKENPSALTLYGSGDFHHVSLCLLRQLTTPFNLLILDKHPDWIRGMPFMHCGTWLNHAVKLPMLQRIFHLGGEVDFENYYRFFTPWNELLSKKIVVFPSVHKFKRGYWSDIPNEPLRAQPKEPLTTERLLTLFLPHLAELRKRPLYISLDKDVLIEKDAVVNWDSGLLSLDEVCTVLDSFIDMTNKNIVGMDIVGDWSQVNITGMWRRLLHYTEHYPPSNASVYQSTLCNEQTNLKLLSLIEKKLK